MKQGDIIYFKKAADILSLNLWFFDKDLFIIDHLFRHNSLK